MIKSILSRIRRSELAKNTGWLLLGNGLKLVIQAAYFVLIARSLGPDGYGAFVAVVAAAAILSPFVGWGTANLMIKKVSRNPSEFQSSWGNGLVLTAATGFAGIAILSAASFAFPMGASIYLLLAVGTADLLFQRFSELCSFAFGAFERFKETARISVLFNLCRLIALVLLLLVKSHPTVEQWATVYLLVSFFVSILNCLSVVRSLGKPVVRLSAIRTDFLEGFYFASSLSAQTIYNDIDKAMLARLGDLASTGIYGAAYRLMDLGIVPIRSLVSAAYPGMFRAGQDGIWGAVRYAKRNMVRATLYSIAAFIALELFAPIVPHVLGHGYDRTVEALRWLALIPLLKSVQFFAADALTGAGFQGTRTLIQVATAVTNIIVNLWIIRAYSWRGAAWSSIGSDLFLSCILWVAIAVIMQKRRTVAGASKQADSTVTFLESGAPATAGSMEP